MRADMPKTLLHLYLPLAIVFALSVLGAWLLPIDAIFKGIFATPAFLTMIGALFQLARDHAAHESKLDLQRKQQIFNLGATSHMANVTFDKHVAFCEKYMAEVDKSVSTLYREGTTKEALKHANALYGVRREFSAWITEDIGLKLAPFENALRQIGAWQGFIENTNGHEAYTDQRIKQINFVNNTLGRVLNLTDPELTGNESGGVDEHVSEEAVKKKIREILDIESLVKLRKGLITEACSYIDYV